MTDNTTARAKRIVEEAREIAAEPTVANTMAKLECRKIEMLAIIVESLDDICDQMMDR